MKELTPQEKAQELYDKYRAYPLLKLTNVQALKCAQIAAEEAKLERQRAIRIAYAFRDQQLEAYESKKKAGNDYAFIAMDVSEECRYVGNAISGNNALSVALNKPDYWDAVIQEIEKL